MPAIESRLFIAVLLAAVSLLTSCAPLVVAGVAAAGTTAVVTDRRTAGTQVDDQSIQLRVGNELSSAFGKQPVHINVNSFNRRVLLTGEVPDEQTKTQAGEIAARSRDVRMVVNELAVAPPSSMGDRTNDTALTAKVRASFVNTKEVAFNSIEIVTERRTVYLLGIVTQREADIAALVASKVSGVQQVVKVFEIVEPGAITPPPAAPAAPPK